jgi:uncharacterized protein (DUF58 family)
MKQTAPLWTKRLPAEFASFAALLSSGLVLGNILLVLLSIIPLLFFIQALNYPRPSRLQLRRGRSSAVAWLNQDTPVSSHLRVGQGVGLVTVRDELPQHFALASGNNLQVFWKGTAPLEADFKYDLRCTKRGLYDIGKAKFELLHFSGLTQTSFVSDRSTTQLMVQQRLVDLRKMRDPRLYSRLPMPHGAVSRMGASTTDFKEIRQYRPGDPFRSINWKASAKRLGSMQGVPLINEYEREGRKTVWIFLDGGRGMSIGSDIENAFEYAVQAAYGLARFYMSRNCNVGLCTYPGGAEVLPDLGRRQAAVLSRAFMSMQLSPDEGQLRRSVREQRSHFEGTSPLHIIITMVRKDNAAETLEGIKELRRSSGREAEVMLLHVNGYDLAVNDEVGRAAATALNLQQLPLLRGMRKGGARVVPWNPRAQSMQRLMLLGMSRRR